MASTKRTAGLAGRRAVLALGTCAAAMLIAGTSAATASPTYAFQQTLSIPGGSFSGYDLAVFDPTDQLYYLTDRSNNGVDVFSTKTNTFVERIGTGLFGGTAGGNNNLAGPNGVSITTLVSGAHLLVAGNGPGSATPNGPSAVVAFDLAANGTTVTNTRTIQTVTATTPSPANRTDGVAYAPNANTILAANNASNPGYLTLINNATSAVIKSINLDGTNGTPNVASNGVEATIFNTVRGTFFVAVPALNSDAMGNPLGAGGVIEIDPATGNILHTYDLTALGLTGGVCSPTGLAQGAGAAMFIACSDPTAGKSVILDPTGTGSIKVVNGISGGDQAYYDPTINTFFEAARFQTGGPVLGVVDATTLALQTLAIGGNDHSVAVDPVTGEVYVATAATTAFPNCTSGCIGVFAAVPEPSTLPIVATALFGLGFLARRRRS